MTEKLTPEQTEHLFKILKVDNAEDACAVVYQRINGLLGRPECELTPPFLRKEYEKEKAKGHAYALGRGNDWLWYGSLDWPIAARMGAALEMQNALKIIGETLEPLGEDDEDGFPLYRRVKVTG